MAGRTLRGALFFLLSWLLFTPPVPAHEMGAMRAKATFLKDGTFRIDVIVDGEHLPTDFTSGESLDAIRSRFVTEARVSFDGATAEVEEQPLTPADVAAIYGSSARSPSKFVFRLTGRTPRGAKTFTWSHGARIGAYLLGVQEEEEGQVAWHWLEGGGEDATFPLKHAPQPLTRAEVILLYLTLGYTHILPKGLDHILFVLGIFFLSLDWRTILKQVTAFTIAHSITLGLTIYGVVSLSPRIVEPMIALSIVYVAVENLFLSEVKPWRIAIVFCFGLLHGMGFAGVLRELGLPRSEFLTALVSFNVGVEGGQLTVIAAAFLAVGLWFGRKEWYRRALAVPASALIAAVGLYWTVQRVFL